MWSWMLEFCAKMSRLVSAVPYCSTFSFSTLRFPRYSSESSFLNYYRTAVLWEELQVQVANYPRPDLKRGSFSQQEEESIINLHEILGNWRLPSLKGISWPARSAEHSHVLWLLVVQNCITIARKNIYWDQELLKLMSQDNSDKGESTRTPTSHWVMVKKHKWRWPEEHIARVLVLLLSSDLWRQSSTPSHWWKHRHCLDSVGNTVDIYGQLHQTFNLLGQNEGLANSGLLDHSSVLDASENFGHGEGSSSSNSNWICHGMWINWACDSRIQVWYLSSCEYVV